MLQVLLTQAVLGECGVGEWTADRTIIINQNGVFFSTYPNTIFFLLDVSLACVLHYTLHLLLR